MFSNQRIGEFPQYKVAYVPDRARAVLKRFDERSRHYETRARFDYREAPDMS
jgi:hypothetical protein